MHVDIQDIVVRNVLQKIQLLKKQREETCLVVYKSKNVFSSDYGKKKIMETCLKNHGVPYSGMSEQKKKNTVKSMRM